MERRKLVSTMKVLGLCLVLGAASSAYAKTIDLGTLAAGASYSFTDGVGLGKFSDDVRFNLSDTMNVSGFVRTFEMSIFGFDLLGIQNFSSTLQHLGQGGFQTLASGTGSPMSFDDMLGPGSYRIAFSGIGNGFLGGIYRGSLQVAAVPEADVWVMLLVGFAVVLYQLRRKQRSLEQQPVAA
jgi:hypothetical protein